MDKVQELIERPLLFSLILSSPSQPRLSIITDGGEGENVDVSCCGPGVNTGCGSADVGVRVQCGARFMVFVRCQLRSEGWGSNLGLMQHGRLEASSEGVKGSASEP